MKRYACIESGVVREIIEPALDGAGDEVPVAQRFTEAFVQSLVEIPEGDAPQQGWTYDGDGFSPPVTAVPTADEVRAAKVQLVQDYMDGKARELNYDNIATAVTYAEEPAVPKFQAEGQALRAWRSLVWQKCYEILDDVLAGARDVPSDDDLLKELPPLSLPSS